MKRRVVALHPNSCEALPADIWRTRNGFAQVQPVGSVAGVTLYTTKSDAASGEPVWSDTLSRYSEPLAGSAIVGLHP